MSTPLQLAGNAHALGKMVPKLAAHSDDYVLTALSFLTADQRAAIMEYSQLYDYLSDDALHRLDSEFGLSMLHLGMMHGLAEKEAKQNGIVPRLYLRRSK